MVKRKSKPSKWNTKSAKAYTEKTATYKEIKKYQSSTKNLIPKLSICRLIKEIMLDLGSTDRIALMAVDCIHEAAEIFLTSLFSDCNLLAHHAKRVTVRPVDMELCLLLRENAAHL